MSKILLLACVSLSTETHDEAQLGLLGWIGYRKLEHIPLHASNVTLTTKPHCSKNRNKVLSAGYITATHTNCEQFNTDATFQGLGTERWLTMFASPSLKAVSIFV